METESSLRHKSLRILEDIACWQFTAQLKSLRHALRKYSENQPRVPADSADGGQWTSADGAALGAGTQHALNGDIRTDVPVDGKPDIHKAIAHLQVNAKPASLNQCAMFVRQALDAGGFNIPPVRDAKNYGSELVDAGFQPVATWSQQLDNLPSSGYLPDYKPEAGDVAVIQPYVGGNSSGHMTMYDGNQWISDFKQRGIWPGAGYRAYKPNYVIYRYPN